MTHLKAFLDAKPLCTATGHKPLLDLFVVHVTCRRFGGAITVEAKHTADARRKAVAQLPSDFVIERIVRSTTPSFGRCYCKKYRL